jgi:hypothetical protein
VQKDKTRFVYYGLTRDLKFRVGPWILSISKVRLVSISVLLIAFLLATVNQLFIDPAIRPRGEMEIEYTTPIDQNITYVVDRKPYPAINSLVVLNTSETWYDGSMNGYLPRFDYDLIVFNLTVNPKNSSIDATFKLWIDHGAIFKQTTKSISETTTMMLELDVPHLMEVSDQWLFRFSASALPAQDVVIENLVVWVDSTVPLVPVSLDLQATDGRSLYDCPMFIQIDREIPYLDVSKDNSRLNSLTLWPNKKNVTFYLRPGGLNGTAKWNDWSYSNDFVPFNVTFSLDEKVAIMIRMLVVRIDLHTNSNYPLTSITIKELYDSWPIYALYVTPDIFPPFLYVPAHRLASWEHAFQSIYIEVYLKEMRYSAYSSRALLIADGYASFNGTCNIEVSVNFSQSSFYGIVMTSDLILWVLSIALFLLVLIRIGLMIHASERTMHIDFRLIPSVLFVVLALIPWYSSTTTLLPFDQYYLLTIHSLSLGPLPIVGFWVDGSAIVWTIPSEVLVWSIMAMIFYWIPLLWSAFRFSTPSDRKGDVKMGFLLFLPSIFTVYVNAGLPAITGGTASYLIPSLIVLLIPMLWLCFVSVLALARRHKTIENEATREEYSVLERDQVETVEDNENAELIPDETSLFVQLFEDFAGFWFVVFLSILLISLPCAVGLYYRIYETGVVYYFTILPLLSLSEFYIVNYWYSIRLAALIIGIPYFFSGLFTILALWRYSRREVSLFWVFLGAFLQFASLLPGIMIFGYISSISQNLGFASWFVFEPYPVVAIIFVVISIIIWFKQAYEDAEIPVKSETITANTGFDEVI